eukprot:NODE_202_length_14999_cov_0.270067.p4 type:complete len:431 gc:universal NODE_202_length_14999_cov_0.270067:6747-5455(-)
MLIVLNTLVFSHSRTFGSRSGGPLDTYTFKGIHEKHTNCGMSKDRANDQVKTWKRGENVPTSWPRNNHAAGFMRYSISSFENSDIVTATNGIFDDPKRIIHYECAEKVCKSGSSNPNGGDPSSVVNSNHCFGGYSIPTWIPDGKYTVQTVWYGTGNSNGNKFQGLRYYVSCLDIYIKGGSPLENVPGYTDYVPGKTIDVLTGAKCKSKATFTGGDVTTPAGSPQSDCKWFTAGKGTVYGCSDDNCFCKGQTDDERCYQRSPPPEYVQCRHDTTPVVEVPPSRNATPPPVGDVDPLLGVLPNKVLGKPVKKLSKKCKRRHHTYNSNTLHQPAHTSINPFPSAATTISSYPSDTGLPLSSTQNPYSTAVTELPTETILGQYPSVSTFPATPVASELVKLLPHPSQTAGLAPVQSSETLNPSPSLGEVLKNSY